MGISPNGQKGISSGEFWWNLEDYVMDLFDKKKTSSEEFKAVLKIFGKDRISEIYAKYVGIKNSVK